MSALEATAVHRTAGSRHEPRQRAGSEARAAGSAGLRYTCDDRPGIRRRMAGKAARYFDSHGRVVRDPATLARIRALVIPPAWTDVWICTDPRGHLQATGRDARGRKQYRYHDAWRKQRDETKFERIQLFASVLPRIRSRTESALTRRGLPREKVLATVVQLLERSLIRVGNDEYARTNGSFGLTTMRDKHVAVTQKGLQFDFRGKSGKHHRVDVDSPRLVRIVRQCRDLPGQQLFQYVDDNGVRRSVNSADVNRYLREISGEDITAKDFRTWGATVLAATALRMCRPARSRAHGDRNVVLAIDAVATLLGNTRSVCRKSYVHPGVLEAYLDGSMHLPRTTRRATHRASRWLRADEVAVLDLLCASSSSRSRRGAVLPARAARVSSPRRSRRMRRSAGSRSRTRLRAGSGSV